MCFGDKGLAAAICENLREGLGAERSRVREREAMLSSAVRLKEPMWCEHGYETT